VLAAAEAREVHDRALWTAPARVPGAHGNATALVGSPETVVSSLLAYVAVGISGFVINGYDPIKDVLDYGRHLIPAVKSATAS
jgi:alkanesulfonate monooxygenase